MSTRPCLRAAQNSHTSSAGATSVETVSLVVAVIAALGAVIAAGAATVQARAAVVAAKESRADREKSETARDEAVALTREANLALERQAKAQEEAVAIAKAQLPRDELEWTYRPGHGDMVEIVNTGNVTVYDVEALGGPGVHCDEDSRAGEIGPGDFIEVGVMPATFGASRREVTMRWRYTPEGEVHEATSRIRPNR